VSRATRSAGRQHMASPKGGAMMANKMLTHNLSEPLNGTKTTTVDINTDSGNLTLDKLSGGEQLLASGTLQYFEK
jgi:hypothetical protein